MKILTINCFNTNGSIGKLINDIEKVLKYKQCSFLHCYETNITNSEIKSKNSIKLCSKLLFKIHYLMARVFGVKYGVGFIPTIKLIKNIKRFKPDIVHVHCPNTHVVNIYMLFWYLKKNNINTIITNHAEFFYTGNCAYAFDCEKFLYGCQNCKRVFDTVHPYRKNHTEYEWNKMKEAFEGFTTCRLITVSNWQLQRLQMSPITKKLNAKTILNGVDIKCFRPYSIEDHIEILKKYGIPFEKKIILHVTSQFSLREDHIKGGKYFLKIAENCNNSDFFFVVAGSVEDKNIKTPKNMKLLGSIFDQKDLAILYSIAQITVLTSKRETYGMVCAESLCSGTPVVGFLAGGSESITIQEYSKFVKHGDIIALKRALIELFHLKDKKQISIAEDAQKKFSREKMALDYYEVYKELSLKTKVSI